METFLHFRFSHASASPQYLVMGSGYGYLKLYASKLSSVRGSHLERSHTYTSSYAWRMDHFSGAHGATTFSPFDRIYIYLSSKKYRREKVFAAVLCAKVKALWVIFVGEFFACIRSYVRWKMAWRIGVLHHVLRRRRRCAGRIDTIKLAKFAPFEKKINVY